MTQNSSFSEKQNKLKALFANCSSETEKYSKIIELGRQQTPIEQKYKTPENIVSGCQSTVYLHTTLEKGHMFFEVESDALISSGLAMILVQLYNGESPEAILQCPAAFIEELGISSSLSPSRANGLYSIQLRIKQEALKAILKKNNS